MIGVGVMVRVGVMGGVEVALGVGETAGGIWLAVLVGRACSCGLSVHVGTTCS